MISRRLNVVDAEAYEPAIIGAATPAEELAEVPAKYVSWRKIPFTLKIPEKPQSLRILPA